MNTGRVVLTGKTRVCPHCKSTILESSSVCPACQHHLRFDPKAIVERRLQPAFSALRVEGGFKHPAGGEPWEYSVVISIRNDRGESQRARHAHHQDHARQHDTGNDRRT